VDSRNSSSSSDAHECADPTTDRSPQADIGGETPSIAHLAEAIESKHQVRERLVRALVRARASAGAASGRPFDSAGQEIPAPETNLGLNPLGEYLLNCELNSRPFRV